MVSHADLTGADVHEPKGADVAPEGTVYISDGAGSGSWAHVPATSIDDSTVFNVNKFSISVTFPDIGTASTIYIPVGVDCDLVKVTSAIQGAIAGSNTVLTVANYAGTTMGTITIAYSASSAGDIDVLSPASNNSFLANTFVRISTDGATSTTMPAILTLDFEYV